MPSQIEVISGIAAGSSYWIDRRVMRIGNNPEAEVCLPCADLAGFAVTLEYRDGQYRAYNRSGTEIQLDGKPLASGTAITWSDGQVLQLAAEVSLLFKSEGDPAPAERPTSADVEDYDEEDEPDAAGETEGEPEEAEEEAAAKRNKAMMQWGVIALCVIGCLLLLMRKKGSQVEAPNVPQFDHVIEMSLAADEIPPVVVERLRHAHSAIIRGDLEAAGKRYERLRDQLIHQHEASQNGLSDSQKELLEFVEYQLQQLNDSGGLFSPF